MYVSAPADPSPPSTSNFIPEFPRNVTAISARTDEEKRHMPHLPDCWSRGKEEFALKVYEGSKKYDASGAMKKGTKRKLTSSFELQAKIAAIKDVAYPGVLVPSPGSGRARSTPAKLVFEAGQKMFLTVFVQTPS